MQRITRAIVLVASLAAAPALAATGGSFTFRFDDGSAASLAGQIAGTLATDGVPITITAGVGDFQPGGSDSRLATIAPGAVPSLPQLGGIGITSTLDRGPGNEAVALGEVIRVTLAATFRLETITLRTFGVQQGFIVYTLPVPGMGSGTSNEMAGTINDFRPGPTDVTTVRFAPGVTEFGITPYTFDNHSPAFLLAAVSGTLVPEPRGIALALGAAIGAAARQRRAARS